MAQTKSYFFYSAGLMEVVEDYPEMVKAVKKMILVDANLNGPERKLLARAYKKLIDARRKQLRYFCDIEKNPPDDDTDEQKQARTDALSEKQVEVRAIYRDILDVINEFLLPNANDQEARVFYLNMKAGFYRDKVDLFGEDYRAESLKASKMSYEEGFVIATTQLNQSNPARLFLVLNFAVFKFEVESLEDEARQMLEKALENANSELGGNKVKGDTGAALGLIQKQLTKWEPKNFVGDAAD